MALVYKDRVKCVTTTTGTGALTLGSAITGFQDFSVIGNANTCCYAIEEVASTGIPTGAWEVGIGTYTSSGTTLSRDTILASSNSGSVVTLAVGSKNVYVTLPAARIGKLIQRVYTTFAADYSSTTVIPIDDTVPTSAEGDELGTLAITPTSTTNFLRVFANFPVVGASGAIHTTVALFKDAGANALNAAKTTLTSSAYSHSLTIDWIEQASGVASQTWRIRYGPNSGTGYLNRVGTGGLFGSALSVISFMIEEWAP